LTFKEKMMNSCETFDRVVKYSCQKSDDSNVQASGQTATCSEGYEDSIRKQVHSQFYPDQPYSEDKVFCTFEENHLQTDEGSSNPSIKDPTCGDRTEEVLLLSKYSCQYQGPVKDRALHNKKYYGGIPTCTPGPRIDKLAQQGAWNSANGKARGLDPNDFVCTVSSIPL
jgi:hypothetical protein